MSEESMEGSDHGAVPLSAMAKAAARANMALIAPDYGISIAMIEQGIGLAEALPPYILGSRLPSEKLEPLNTKAAHRPNEKNRDMKAPPPIVLPPKWGPPLPAVW